MKIIRIVTTLVLLSLHTCTWAIRVSDLKAGICCSKYNGYYCTDNDELDQAVGPLAEGKVLQHTDGPCHCIKNETDKTVTYLGVNNQTGVLEFDSRSDGEPDIRIDMQTIKDKDKFRFDRLGSDCATVSSYIVFRIPPGVATESEGQSDNSTAPATEAEGKSDKSRTGGEEEGGSLQSSTGNTASSGGDINMHKIVLGVGISVFVIGCIGVAVSKYFERREKIVIGSVDPAEPSQAKEKSNQNEPDAADLI